MTEEVQGDTIRLLGYLLGINKGRLSKDYVDYVTSQHHFGPYFFPSFLVPLTPLDKDVRLGPKCAGCGKRGTLKACSRCKGRKYCSRECQLKDWPTHKAACKAAAAATSAPSTSTPAAAPTNGSSSSCGSIVIKLEKYHRGLHSSLSLKASSASQLNKGKEEAANMENQHLSNRKSDPRKRFLVKIQAPLGPIIPGMPLASPESVIPGDLMLYDEKRKIQAMVQDPAAKSVLVPIIRAKGYLGAKGYFWAVQEAEDRIRVFTDEWPKQQHNW